MLLWLTAGPAKYPRNRESPPDPNFLGGPSRDLLDQTIPPMQPCKQNVAEFLSLHAAFCPEMAKASPQWNMAYNSLCYVHLQQIQGDWNNSPRAGHAQDAQIRGQGNFFEPEILAPLLCLLPNADAPVSSRGPRGKREEAKRHPRSYDTSRKPVCAQWVVKCWAERLKDPLIERLARIFLWLFTAMSSFVLLNLVTAVIVQTAPHENNILF